MIRYGRSQSLNRVQHIDQRRYKYAGRERSENAQATYGVYLSTKYTVKTLIERWLQELSCH